MSTLPPWVSIKAIDNTADRTAILEHLTQARSVIGELALRSDAQAERLQAIERLSSVGSGLFASAEANARAEYVHYGDSADIDARYFAGDAVRLGEKKESYRFDDSVIEVAIPGLLTERIGLTAAHQRLIDAYQRYAVANAISKRLPQRFGPILAKTRQNFARAAVSMPGKAGQFFREAFASEAGWKRAVSATAGSGGELLSVPTVGDALRQPVDLARRIAGLFPEMPAPSASFKPPIVTGRAIPRKRTATTNDPVRYPVTNFSTSDATVSCVSRTLVALVDDTWPLEGGLVLADPIGFILDWIMKNDMLGMEMAYLHGDTAGTHQDTLSTWTMGGLYTAGDLDGTDSPLRFYIGTRARAHDDSKTGSAGGTFEAADHFGALDAMGVHGDGAVMAVGLHGLYTQLLANSLFTTVDKFGAAATLVTGEIGRVGKTPVIVSQVLPDQFDTTSGVYTGSNAGSIFNYFNPSGFARYVNAPLDADFEVREEHKGALYLGMRRSEAFVASVVSGEYPAFSLYNL